MPRIGLRVAARIAWRLGLVALHLAEGLLTAAIVFPVVRPERRLGLKQRWSARLLVRFGVVLDCPESTAPGKEQCGMIVANHVSWLDIFVINAVRPAAFVCKDDVRAWPVIGWLCARADSIFIARGSSRDARRVCDQIASALAGGADVAVFPEGTSTDGTCLLPFRGALMQPAVELQCRVSPVLISYLDDAGEISRMPAYVGDTTLLASMRTIAAQRRTIARVSMMPSVDSAGMDRRQLAGSVEALLREAMNRRAKGPDRACRDERMCIAGA